MYQIEEKWNVLRLLFGMMKESTAALLQREQRENSLLLSKCREPSPRRERRERPGAVRTEKKKKRKTIHRKVFPIISELPTLRERERERERPSWCPYPAHMVTPRYCHQR
jgi:hypothetical protein